MSFRALMIGGILAVSLAWVPVAATASETPVQLNKQALVLFNQGRNAEAETLYLRALATHESARLPDDQNLATILGNFGMLYKTTGQYVQAEPLYKRSLAIRERILGQNHPDVADSLNNLGSLYSSQARYAVAEPLLKRSLAIFENALGPDHPAVATSLNNLALIYSEQGQYDQAEPLLRRSLAIREKALGQNNPAVAQSLNNLATLYDTQGQYAKAEPFYKRSLAIVEKGLGADHPAVAMTLSNLAGLYRSQGQYAQAEPLLKRSLAIRERAFGPDHPDVAMSLNNLANLFENQGQYARAEPLLKRSLAIWEKALGPNHPTVATNLNNLASLYTTLGLYKQVEPLHKRALAIREMAFGRDHPDVAYSLNNLSGLYETQGQYVQAEPLLRRALAIFEKTLGPDHPNVAKNLDLLAGLYDTQGQSAQVEPLFKRALAIREKALGRDHPDVAYSLSSLAGLHETKGQYAQAEALHKRALAIREKALGLDHPDVAASLSNLAGLYETQSQYAQAEPLYKRSLAIREKAFGPDHPSVASTLSNLAFLYKSQGLHAQTEPLYKRSLAIREKTFGPDHPNVADTLNNLARLYNTQGQFLPALSLARRASSIYRQRIVAGGTGDAAVREASENRSGFRNHVSLLSRNPDKEPVDSITDEAFQIIQLEQASGTASAIAKMAVRFAKGDDALAGLVKRKQDATDRRTKRELQLVAASSKPPKDRKVTDEQRLRDDIALAGKEIGTIDAELARQFPEYQELTGAEPVSIRQVRALLKPEEAMLVYSLGDTSFLWVVKAEGADFMPLQVDYKDVVAKVAAVRAEMEFDGSGQPKRVSVRTLHELHQRLFAPAMPHLAGIKHVMVVPAGPLQSLPFGMLVASPPPEIKSDANYRQVAWLARHYAFSVLPAVSSIQAFRQFAKASRSQEPFAGFGDPLIGGTDSATRGKRAKIDVASVFRNLVAAANANQGSAPASVATTEIADVEAIRNAPRLPETADEIREMARVLKGDQNAIWLQENATETKIKHLDFFKYRTIAFATHGVMAGEIKGVGESGLILTPPREGSLEDDGYLSAGEIAKLKLNADWVVLSACNTAAADGTPGAEGLSGLAKAFFYAGARSLLVSHWPVASEATVPLTTAMLREYEANPYQGKAEAHRKAMIALMATPKHPEYGHPIFWAPFVVVGEGGEITSGKLDTSGRTRQ